MGAMAVIIIIMACPSLDSFVAYQMAFAMDILVVDIIDQGSTAFVVFATFPKDSCVLDFHLCLFLVHLFLYFAYFLSNILHASIMAFLRNLLALYCLVTFLEYPYLKVGMIGSW
jgi:membrane associated rhomboid family serine protease